MVYLKTCKIIAQGLNYNALQKYNIQSTGNVKKTYNLFAILEELCATAF